MINNNELIDKIKSYNRFLNSDSLNKAYNFALEAHQNQKRDEGVPYIIHPVAVAKILTDLKLDSATITTGLLHDTIEDTNVTYETVKKEFGEEVANLVETPVMLKGKFDPEYLVLPDELLNLTMVNHQRYFPMKSEFDNKLINSFLFVANNFDKKNLIINDLLFSNNIIYKAFFNSKNFTIIYKFI